MNKIRRCFNRAAFTYNNYCYPQQMIGDKLIASIYQHSQTYDLVADLGCGTGLITQKLADTLYFKELHAIDISEKSLECAQKTIQHPHVFLSHDNITNLSHYEKKFNLLFSNMVLHWNENIHQTLKIIKENTAKNGIIAFTVPIIGTFHELNASSKNHFYSLADWHKQCAQAGIHLITAFEETFVFAFGSWIQAIKSIKATGANHLFASHQQGLSCASRYRSSSFFKESKNEKFLLTYQVGIFLGTSNVK